MIDPIYGTEYSDEIITPWPYEGRRVRKGDVRRFPPQRIRTRAQEAERVRLATVENAGRCMARRQNVDAWCRRHPMHGMRVCWTHGGQPKSVQKAAAKRVRSAVAEQVAARILERARVAA